MTKQDRLLAIEDNLTYLNNVLAELAEHYTWDRLILVGFSQGVAIAWRLLAHSLTNPNPRLTVHALVGLGGDIPPDVAESGALNNLGAMPILLGRGHKDRLYDREKFNADLAICEAANIEYRSIEFEGAHDWASGFTHAVNVVLGAMD